MEAASAPMFYFVDQAETMGRVYDDINAGKSAVKSVERMRDGPRMSVGSGVRNAVVQYRTSKASLIAGVQKTVTWTNNILRKVSKRVDMWRTTLPTLKNYGKTVERLWSDSKVIYNDFTWRRYFDIERKWDRRRESLFRDYTSLYYSSTGYMKYLYWDANRDRGRRDRERRYVSQKLHRTIVPSHAERRLDRIINERTNMIDSAVLAVDEYRMIPYNTLDLAASTLYSLAVLESEYLGPSQNDTNKTVQDAAEDRIRRELSNLQQTYVDTRELSAYIAQERAKVRVQMVRATQLQSNIEINYANLVTHEKEIGDAQGVVYEQSLQVLFAGKELYEEYHGNYLRNLR